MSNEEINIASTIDDETNPIASGQVGEEVEVQAETPEQELELFDYTEIADKVIKLQVDGEEVVIPVKEALAGYQRQADYTRKTQELSEQRKQVQYASALAEALQNDPAATLQLLNQQYGLSAQPQEEDAWIDPAEQQLRQLEQRIAAFEQQKAMDELTRTIDTLQSKYGEDFDADEVVAKALATGVTDLEAVFKQITFDKVYSKASEATKKLTEEQARVQAKRSAAVVSGGSATKATVTTQTAQPKSVFEAFENAKRTLNL
jgi:predicted metal-dependent hydrolase